LTTKQDAAEFKQDHNNKIESHRQNMRTSLPATHLCLLINVFKSAELLPTYDCPICDTLDYDRLCFSHNITGCMPGRQNCKSIKEVCKKICCWHLSVSVSWNYCTLFTSS